MQLGDLIHDLGVIFHRLDGLTVDVGDQTQDGVGADVDPGAAQAYFVIDGPHEGAEALPL